MRSVVSIIGFCALATWVARGEIVTKTISYDANGTTFRSFLAYDSARTGQQGLPGVLVFPEWWGLNDFTKQKAEELAGLGYVALVVDMYGEGRSTTNAEEAKSMAGQLYGKPLTAERAQLGLDQLQKTGVVDPNKLAAIGFCFGGAVSQALAYTGAPLKGIVSFHGALVPAPDDAGTKTRARFLILHGALDPLVKKEQVEAFVESLNRQNLNYELIVYSGAVHAFMNPNADKARAAGLKGVGYNPEVAKEAWSQMRSFLQGLFGSS
ncbi:MAG: dienelactone hydrolase family protein [Verrucomicrobia bacterium]|nr:dienelactone hydrolase family protein [Verrucomicrobiota bacterium]